MGIGTVPFLLIGASPRRIDGGRRQGVCFPRVLVSLVGFESCARHHRRGYGRVNVGLHTRP